MIYQLPIDQYQARIKAPFATLGVIADDSHVQAIHFLPTSVAAKSPVTNTIAHLATVQLMSYLDNPKFRFDLPLRLSGSKHQLDVWHAMQKIPAGKVNTYGELAETIGSNPRAVGTACGRNPVPIVVPCHRITAANGLGGFMGGKLADPLAIKRWLLTHEGYLLL
ncbi:MAG TPA: methylated-DNA--[protein]-cysteine S-methyltransferase [Usitatibacteraceae bacterium]